MPSSTRVVEMRRLHIGIASEAEVAPAQVIRDDDEKVWLVRSVRHKAEDERGEEENGFHAYADVVRDYFTNSKPSAPEPFSESESPRHSTVLLPVCCGWEHLSADCCGMLMLRRWKKTRTLKTSPPGVAAERGIAF